MHDDDTTVLPDTQEPVSAPITGYDKAVHTMTAVLEEQMPTYAEAVNRASSTDAVIEGQKRALELVVHGAPLSEVLDVIVRTVETQSSHEVVGSILLLSEDGQHLLHGAAPSLPGPYCEAIDGIEIGPTVGSCGTAAFTARTVVVRDIATDPLWVNFKELALAHELRACWSTPILSSHGKVLGTFALYHHEPAVPTARDVEIVELLGHTATLIIEHKRLDAEREGLLARERKSRLEAEAARAQAESANRMKDEFLATVSHELRTPLNAMLGWASLLQGGSLDTEGRAKAVATIERNARTQARLIEDLLDVSRILQGKFVLAVGPVELVRVVHAALDAVKPAAEAKGIRIQPVLDSHATIVGDPERLQQITWNLLSNAIKFTPKGGRVQVTLRKAASYVELSVADDGIGIAPDFLSHVFEPFRQAERTATRRSGGLGLGLSIVHSLVQMHGGTVTVASDGEGRGSTFVVQLPMAPLRADKNPVPAQPGEGDAQRTFDVPEGVAGLRILVVDDEKDTRDLLAFLLGQAETHVTLAANTTEAYAALQRERFDLILSDVGMPGEDGLSFMRRVRQLPADEGGRTPAIALTAYARTEDRAQALRAGFSTHLTKPIEPTELLLVMAAVTTNHR